MEEPLFSSKEECLAAWDKWTLLKQQSINAKLNQDNANTLVTNQINDEKQTSDPIPSSISKQSTIIPKKQNIITTSFSPSSSFASSSSSSSSSSIQIKRSPVTPISNYQRTILSDDESNIETNSGLRLSKRHLSNVAIQSKILGCTKSTIPHLSSQLSITSTNDWVLFAVVSHKSAIRDTSKGERYIIFTLTDMKENSINLFLFGEAFKQFYREDPGVVIIVANAKILSQHVGSQSFLGSQHDDATLYPQSHSQIKSSSKGPPPLSLSVSNPAQLVLIGISLDFSYCAGYKHQSNPSHPHIVTPGMNRCKNPVDKRKGLFCPYHIKDQYNKIKSKRMEVNRTSTEHGLIKFEKQQTNWSQKGRFKIRGGDIVEEEREEGRGIVTVGLKVNPASIASPLLKSVFAKGAESNRVQETLERLTSERSSILKQKIVNNSAKSKSHSSSSPPSFSSNHSESSSVSRASKSNPVTLTTNILSNISSIPSKLSAPSTVPSTQSMSVNPLPPLRTLPLNQVRAQVPSLTERKQRLNNAKALSIMSKIGPIPAPNPNDTSISDIISTNQPSKKRKSGAQDQIDVKFQEDGLVLIEKISSKGKENQVTEDSIREFEYEDETPLMKLQNAKKARLVSLFGSVDLSSEAGKSLLSATSINQKLLTDVKTEERNEEWDMLASKEEAKERLSQVRDIPIIVWTCVEKNCGKKSEVFLQWCKTKGHKVEKRKGIKRFFECFECKSKCTSISSLLPRHPCPKCGSTVWKATGMISEVVTQQI